MPFVVTAVPQQPNSFDCGLFASEFARRFCLNAPAVFSTREEDGYPYMLTREWFPPEEAGLLKRDHLHRAILALAGLGPEPAAFPGRGEAEP
jgi:sentrin-specific protease 7